MAITSYYNSGVDINGKKVEMYRQTDWSSVASQDNSWRTSFTHLLELSEKDEDGTTATKAEQESSLINLVSSTSNLNVNKDIYLLMEEGFPKIATTNESEYPIKSFLESYQNTFPAKVISAANIFQNIVGAATKGITYQGQNWQPWIQNLPAWAGSKGISTQYTFKFALGQYGMWNAFEEVVKPILNLAAPCLPRKQGLAFASGPFPNTVTLLTKMLSNLTNKTESDYNIQTAVDFFGDVLTKGYVNLTWTMQFGTWMTFYHMIIENCEISFSNKVDDQGWPVQGSIKLTLKGLVPLALNSKGAINQAAKFGISSTSKE